MKKKNKKHYIILFVVLLLITIIAIVFLKFYISKNAGESSKEEIDWKQIVREESSGATTVTEEEIQEGLSMEEESSTGIEEEQAEYPAPAYNFKEERIKIEVPGIKKEYKIAWVSDLHMVTDSGVSDYILESDLDAVKTRYDMFQSADGMHGEDLLDDIIDYLNYNRFDGIIFGGDMLDYCSESNMNRLKKEFGRLNKAVPVLYIRADHDYGFWYGGDAFTETMAEDMHKTMSDQDDLNRKYLDFGEFEIIGINRSTKDMFPEQRAILDEWISAAQTDNKPVIIATHVPYESKVDDKNEETLYDLSMKVRNKVYYWGGGEYVPNDVTGGYLESVYAQDSPVLQVLAGHMHAGWDGYITESLKQHIFEPAYSGSVGVIDIVPKIGD